MNPHQAPGASFSPRSVKSIGSLVVASGSAPDAGVSGGGRVASGSSANSEGAARSNFVSELESGVGLLSGVVILHSQLEFANRGRVQSVEPNRPIRRTQRHRDRSLEVKSLAASIPSHSFRQRIQSGIGR